MGASNDSSNRSLMARRRWVTGLLKLMVLCELYFSCVGQFGVVVRDVRGRLGAWGGGELNIWIDRERGSQGRKVKSWFCCWCKSLDSSQMSGDDWGPGLAETERRGGGGVSRESPVGDTEGEKLRCQIH